MTYETAVKIARDHQPDAEFAAEALEEAGADFNLARRALLAVFGFDVFTVSG